MLVFVPELVLTLELEELDLVEELVFILEELVFVLEELIFVLELDFGLELVFTLELEELDVLVEERDVLVEEVDVLVEELDVNDLVDEVVGAAEDKNVHSTNAKMIRCKGLEKSDRTPILGSLTSVMPKRRKD